MSSLPTIWISAPWWRGSAHRLVGCRLDSRKIVSNHILGCNIITTSDGARDGTKTNIGNSGWRSSPRPQRREPIRRPDQAPHPQAPNRRPRHRARWVPPSPWHDPRQGTRNPRAREYWPTRTARTPRRGRGAPPTKRAGDPQRRPLRDPSDRPIRCRRRRLPEPATQAAAERHRHRPHQGVDAAFRHPPVGPDQRGRVGRVYRRADERPRSGDARALYRSRYELSRLVPEAAAALADGAPRNRARPRGALQK